MSCRPGRSFFGAFQFGWRLEGFLGEAWGPGGLEARRLKGAGAQGLGAWKLGGLKAPRLAAGLGGLVAARRQEARAIIRWAFLRLLICLSSGVNLGRGQIAARDLRSSQAQGSGCDDNMEEGGRGPPHKPQMGPRGEANDVAGG